MKLFKTFLCLSLLLFLLAPALSAQDLIWTGAARDSDFFNEKNWSDTKSRLSPPNGTIDPGIRINRNLIINMPNVVVGGKSGVPADILMGTGNLTIKNSMLRMQAGFGIKMGGKSASLRVDKATIISGNIENAHLTLSGDSKLYLEGKNPIDSLSTINITSNDAWIYLPAMSPLSVSTLARITIFGHSLQDEKNARITEYYYGTAISAFSSKLTPLRIYDKPDFGGRQADICVNIINSDGKIPGNLDRKISSFRLKKGYMATFAVNPDGTGMSKVYIASESDLWINALPSALDNCVSFVRVVPWIWVNKKGTGGGKPEVGASWYYNWGRTASSLPDKEYAPMGFGKGSLRTKAAINDVVSKEKVTHIMSFNEPDNCKDQSGVGDLCIVDTAIVYEQNTMKTGLRIVSPCCRQGEELRWLKNLNNLAVPLGIRMDVIGMHWYDWSAKPKSTPNEDAGKVFERFKKAVTACYNYYKMPIWITEFNANPFRTREVQDKFLELALPWLEQTPYVERYAYFQPSSGSGSFFDENGNITSTGKIYLNQVSTPAIREEDYNLYNNNLQSRMGTPASTPESDSSKQ